MDLFQLLGNITIKNSEAVDALDEVSNKGQKTESKLKKTFSAVGKGALAVGKTVGAGLMAGGAAMGALTVKALNLSGELEQNMGGSEAVFKDYAGKMQETAKNAFQNMGLSTSDFLGTANKMGALFQGAGFDIQESADLSSKAMQRAADVASIMGIDTSSAMEAIAGAAKGNFTMMDNLGVAMNDTTLNAYALEKGMNKTTQEMTNQEKIGLAMEMFMEKTAYAAGNYAKENETLAGSLGTAKAALTNFLDGSGSVDQLVNAFSNAADVIIKNVTEIAPRLISGITDIANKVIPMIPPLMEKLLPVVLEGATSLINGIVAILPQLVDMLTTSVMPQLLTAFVSVINALISALPSLMQTICSALPSLIPQLISGLVSMIVTLCTNISQIIQPIIDNLPMIVQSIVMALVQNIPLLIDAGIQLMMGLFKGMLSLLGKIPEILKAIFNGIVDGIKSLFGIHSPSKVMDGIGRNIVEGLIKGVKDLLGKCTTVFTSLWSGVKNIFSNVGGWFKDKFTDAKEKIVSAFSNVKDKLTEPFTKAKETIGKVVEKIKGIFNFEWKIPKPKLPKFSVSGGKAPWGFAGKGSLPKVGVKWNAEGAIMKEPMLFGYNPTTGNFEGGGEAGDEAIAPIDTLQQYVKTAVQSETTTLTIKLDRIIDLLVQFFPDMIEALNIQMYLDKGVLVAETANDFDVALGKIAIKKGRGR